MAWHVGIELHPCAFRSHPFSSFLLARVNYVLCATTVPFDRYMSSTALGIFPGSFFYTYIGAGIGNIEGFIAGTEKADPQTVALTIGGWLLAIVAFVAIFRFAKTRLAERGLDSIVEQRDDTMAEDVEDRLSDDCDNDNGDAGVATNRASCNLSEGLLG